MVLERAIVPPIVLRSRRAGDRVRLEQGTKTLKALFGEWKVPLGDRWKVPILADRNGVLEVLGSPVGRRTLVRWGMETAEAADAVLGVRAEVQEGTSEQQF
jgi:tRNA(Ile)-lysidine synthetase-like protein